MSGTHRIHIEHVSRIEGHGSLRINTREGAVEEVRLEIVEANRFFESIVLGLPPEDIAQTVSRICGICCVGHQLAALKAVEAALGIVPDAQTLLLRKLLNESQFLQSHALHLYFLAVPDYVGAKSILPLAQSQPDLVRRALRLKKLANDFTALIGGRTLHPMAPTLGGFRRFPGRDALAGIRRRLADSVTETEAMVEFVAGLDIPQLERETEYVSLKAPDEYALYDGQIYSSLTGELVDVSQYRTVTNEFTVPHSTAKWARWNRESYMVGALARVNNNFAQLHPAAQAVAERLGIEVPCFNPYMNNLAQLVELVHCTHNSLAMLDEALDTDFRSRSVDFSTRAGTGAGAVEVPRGVLFHEYGFDDQGLCSSADAVIPTSQNVNNIEKDMQAFVPQLLGKVDEATLAQRMEMLLRAYDPCISCSVHLLEVEFV
ncbi:MAG: Ni/Fe hydrogenase subunit alpha [Gammaproteobacteria bacterium]